MATKTQELPEVGEIVIATVAKISDHGAYVTLDEYNSIQGFLHISEIAPGWVRKVSKYVKEEEKKVLLVKNIDTDRGEIDLSLKQISKDQRKKKLLDVKRFEKEQGILKNIKDKTNLSSKEVDELEDKLLSKYDSVYDAIIEIAVKNVSIIDDLRISDKIKKTIQEISTKIKLPTVEIRGVLELTSNKSDGIEIIRKTLLDAIKESKNEKIQISYIGAPRYRLSVVAQDFKTAEKILKPNMLKLNGVFKFSREESKKTREG